MTVHPSRLEPPEAPIVVADADRPAARALAAALSRLGLPAEFTGSARDLLARARERSLRLVIADAVLMDAAGLAVVARLRARWPDLAAILTSGEYRPEVEMRARECGVLYYTPKPVPVAIVHAIAARVLGRPGASAARRPPV